MLVLVCVSFGPRQDLLLVYGCSCGYLLHFLRVVPRPWSVGSVMVSFPLPSLASICYDCLATFSTDALFATKHTHTHTHTHRETSSRALRFP
jgi:hypothetical protein